MDQTADPAGCEAVNGAVAADDFTVIPGVGSAINRRLHDAGVVRFHDLAALDNDGLARLLAGIPALSADKISNADWVGRAAMLARALEANGEQDDSSAGEEDAQRMPGHDSFVLRVDTQGGSPPRVHLQHVGTGAERRAVGLERLPDLVARLLAQDLGTRVPLAGPAVAEELSRPAAVTQEHLGAPAPILEELPIVMRTGTRVIGENQPFAIDTVLDLDGMTPSPPPTTQVAVAAFARRVGDGRNPLLVGHGHGGLALDRSVITIPASGLPAGTYRLEAVVELTDQVGSGPRGRLARGRTEIMLVVG